MLHTVLSTAYSCAKWLPRFSRVLNQAQEWLFVYLKTMSTFSFRMGINIYAISKVAVGVETSLSNDFKIKISWLTMHHRLPTTKSGVIKINLRQTCGINIQSSSRPLPSTVPLCHNIQFITSTSRYRSLSLWYRHNYGNHTSPSPMLCDI